MKIGIQTWGSHGDIRPFLALAEGLQAAGHDVHLVITCLDSKVYEGIPSAHGVKITVLPTPALTPEQEMEIGRAVYRTRNPLAQMLEILRLCYAPFEDAMFEAAQKLCAESELLIGHHLLHPLQIAAKKAGLPYVSVLLTHGVVPSAYDHPIGVPALGKAGNRALWWLVKTLINKTMLRYPNRLRRQLGMTPAKDVIKQIWITRPLTLLAVSPQLCVRQPDWPVSVQVCGFLNMPNIEVEGKIPEALEAFLRAGEAPVYMTFGSWTPRDIAGQMDALNLLTEAARLAGCRAIIQSPSARECGFESDDQFLYVSAAPHHAIFPHCSAVVHHGGAGTTQSATLAGKPSIVVAHIGEQEHWARELCRIGIAVKPVKRRNVTARTLAEQIRAVRNAPPMAMKAKAVGEAMKKENGVAEAVELIGRTFGHRTSI